MIARISAADSMPTPSGGPLKSGSCRSDVRQSTSRARGRPARARRCPTGRRRSTGIAASSSVRNTSGCRSHAGTELGDEDRDAERDRRRDQQREDRRIERAPDERQRAELARDRIPDLGPPEAEAELLNRQHRLPHQLEADRRDDAERGRARTAPVPSRNRDRPGRFDPRTADRSAYETLIFAKRRHLQLDDRSPAAARSRGRRSTSDRRSAPTSRSRPSSCACALSFGFS